MNYFSKRHQLIDLYLYKSFCLHFLCETYQRLNLRYAPLTPKYGNRVLKKPLGHSRFILALISCFVAVEF